MRPAGSFPHALALANHGILPGRLSACVRACMSGSCPQMYRPTLRCRSRAWIRLSSGVTPDGPALMMQSWPTTTRQKAAWAHVAPRAASSDCSCAVSQAAQAAVALTAGAAVTLDEVTFPAVALRAAAAALGEGTAGRRSE